jgi:hypothetical protein
MQPDHLVEVDLGPSSSSDTEQQDVIVHPAADTKQQQQPKSYRAVMICVLSTAGVVTVGCVAAFVWAIVMQ